MYGNDMGTLNITASGTEQRLLEVSGNQGDKWYHYSATVDVSFGQQVNYLSFFYNKLYIEELAELLLIPLLHESLYHFFAMFLFQILFSFSKGSGSQSDAALDDIVIQQGVCRKCIFWE